ncbi:MAG: PKD domain-containing protein, partial [Bacteroidales bacterium]|nr:PKD domain-containing protein [Bacteroidales bacterium]
MSIYKGKYCILKILILGFFLLLSCEHGNTPLPDITPEINPPEGLTTTSFEFDLTKTFSYDPNQKLFVRWDWEGDSVFDTPFLHENILSHRYYAAGAYNPRAEIMDAAGQTSDSSFHIIVDQGYSNPRPCFTISPQTGNIYTPFTFDASITRDDEDSLSSLLFKWDFEGDGVWDTKPDNSPIAEHIYPKTSLYHPKVHVEDPSGKANIGNKMLRVTLLDSCIHPKFTTIPEFLIQNEENIFDASESSFDCNENETLWYKWDFNNDGFYETEWLENPITSHIFPFEQKYWVKLVVKNSKGLENFIVKEFWMYHQNQPPTARFRVSTYGGNTQTSFRFDAWNCKDLEDAPSQMLTRWDF